MTEYERSILRDALDAATRERTIARVPMLHSCAGCGRDLREGGYTNDCGTCKDRNRIRRRRGRPDGYRFDERAGQWLYSAAWLNGNCEPAA